MKLEKIWGIKWKKFVIWRGIVQKRFYLELQSAVFLVTVACSTVKSFVKSILADQSCIAVFSFKWQAQKIKNWSSRQEPQIQGCHSKVGCNVVNTLYNLDSLFQRRVQNWLLCSHYWFDFVCFFFFEKRRKIGVDRLSFTHMLDFLMASLWR